MSLEYRQDLIHIFNNAKFSLRHYARGYLKVPPGKSSGMMVNRIFIPLSIPENSCNYIAEKDRIYHLQTGKLYFIPATLPVEFCLDEKTFFLSIHTSFEIFPGVELFSSCTRMTVTDAPEQAAKLQLLMDTEKENSYCSAVLAGSLVLSLQSFLMTFYDPREFHTSTALQQYAFLTEYLKEKATARTHVKDLAKLRGESRENFSRHFSRTTKLTPKELIDHFVIQRALELIRKDHSFKEIASILEFSNEFVFSRYFKRNMKQAPSQWRKHCKNILQP